MGVPFATDLKTYAEGLSISTGKVGVIAKNPEQSKHLEAATLTIFGLELDFVNLRSEEYTEDSRIPTVVCKLFHNRISPDYCRNLERRLKTPYGETSQSIPCFTTFILVLLMTLRAK